MIISVDVENAFDRINYFSVIQTLNKLGTEENDFSITKGVCEGCRAGSVRGVCDSRSRGHELKPHGGCSDDLNKLER